MVKIRERDNLYDVPIVVEMYHIGPEGYSAGLYPYDLWGGVMRPPWDPDFYPETGHLIFVPTILPWTPELNTCRFFDLFKYTEEHPEGVADYTAAWDFYYQMLGHPYRMISRCRYCFPHGHRYLTI